MLLCLEETRDGLGEYLDKGTSALKKINSVINDMGGKYSLFGCNGIILAAVVVLTILILMIL